MIRVRNVFVCVVLAVMAAATGQAALASAAPFTVDDSGGGLMKPMPRPTPAPKPPALQPAPKPKPKPIPPPPCKQPSISWDVLHHMVVLQALAHPCSKRLYVDVSAGLYAMSSQRYPQLLTSDYANVYIGRRLQLPYPADCGSEVHVSVSHVTWPRVDLKIGRQTTPGVVRLSGKSTRVSPRSACKQRPAQALLTPAYDKAGSATLRLIFRNAFSWSVGLSVLRNGKAITSVTLPGRTMNRQPYIVPMTVTNLQRVTWKFTGANGSKLIDTPALPSSYSVKPIRGTVKLTLHGDNRHAQGLVLYGSNASKVLVQVIASNGQANTVTYTVKPNDGRLSYALAVEWGGTLHVSSTRIRI